VAHILLGTVTLRIGLWRRGGTSIRKTDRRSDMTERVTKTASDVKLIVFACEAGMGSSLMGANQLKKMVKKAKLDIAVVHRPVGQLADDADVIVVHQGLAKQAREKVPTAAIVPFVLFMNDPSVKQLVATLKAGEPVVSKI